MCLLKQILYQEWVVLKIKRELLPLANAAGIGALEYPRY